MKKIKTILQLLPALVLAAVLSSCGGSATKSTGDTAKLDSAGSAKISAHAAMAAPFDMVEVTHNVKDYAQWRPVFDADSTARKGAGLETVVVSRGTDSANQVQVVFKVSDVAKAKAFVADPRLKEAMDKGGVTSKPNVEFLHVIRFNAAANEKQWVIVTHKVKDFDAWVKVYDGEGTAKRASEGMVDVLMARGTDDANVVQLVFDITDPAKAKAAIFSDDKKKLMMSAGVIGKPKIEFFSEAK